MKKWMKMWFRFPLAVILMLCMLLSLTGCGGSGAATGETEEKSSEEAAESEETDNGEAASEAVTVEEQVLVEWEGLKITATGLEESAYPVLKLLVENDTSYGISLEATKLFVNGCYMEDSSYGLSLAEIPAGKKANAKLSLNPGVAGFLEKAGITEVGMIDVEFTARDTSMDYYDDASVLYTSELVNIQTSAYENMDTDAIAEGKELYNQNGIRIVAKELSAYAGYDFNYALFLYVENTTDKDIVLNSYDVTVDGFVPENVSGLYGWQIPAGSYSVDGLIISCDENIPNEDALKDVEELEFGVKIYDVSCWNGGYDDSGLLADTGMLVYEQ